jgi:phosphoserine phosphatase
LIIATLIAADGLGEREISIAATLLRGAQGAWVEPGSAYELFLTSSDGVDEALRTALPGVDVVVQPGAHRRKRLFVADMDSTMITVECIDELADYAGLKSEVAAITERAMRGELDFEAALAARVRLLEGMPAETIDRCREERVRITPGAKTLVRTMKARGATCILVSGGFTRFAAPVAAEIGFDRVVANELEIEKGHLTGRARPPIVGAATKRQVLLDAAAELGIQIEDTLAVGDGANDIPMLQAAGLGVAYHAKPAARAAADAAIDHNDLTALLYAQGIPKSDWVTD